MQANDIISQDQKFTDGVLTVTIKNNLLIVEEIYYPTYEFELVDEIPSGYEVWNIGKHMPKGFIPYAQVDSNYRVNTNTLKALFIKTESTNL